LIALAEVKTAAVAWMAARAVRSARRWAARMTELSVLEQ
jgi:hypothetical protein